MLSGKMIQRYSNLEAWLYDKLIGERTVNVHAYVLQQVKLSDILAEQQARSVLDVGCGGGQAVLRLKQRYPHLQLIGVDLSESQIIRAQQRARQRGQAVQFTVANAQALPFLDQSFDVVYSFGSVKHWPDPRQGIAECWRVLKAGGELLLLDNTSDATREQVRGMYEMAGLPRLLERPITAIVYRLMVPPARPMRIYQQIAAQVGMPPGTVTQLPDLPAFLFRTQKPAPVYAAGRA